MPPTWHFLVNLCLFCKFVAVVFFCVCQWLVRFYHAGASTFFLVLIGTFVLCFAKLALRSSYNKLINT